MEHSFHHFILGFLTSVGMGYLIFGTTFYVLEKIFPSVDKNRSWNFRKTTFTKIFYWVQIIIFHTILDGSAALWAGSWNKFINFEGFVPESIIAQAIVFFVCMDFLIYWSHRLLSHGPLWNFHKIHHAEPDIDWMSTPRMHPLELVQFFTIMTISYSIFPISGEAFGLVSAANTFFGPLPHSNVRLPVGKFIEGIIVTPQFHRLHHRKTYQLQHSNFATAISAWDKLFGSYQHPENHHDESPEYGIPDSDFPKKLHLQFAYPIVRLFRRKK